MTDAAADIARRVIDRLRDRGATVAVAESLTGGLVVSALVGVPGASSVVRGGFVAYATDVKHSVLGVDAALLAAEGAVHPEVARQMAEGVRILTAREGIAADIGIATTGVAGPDPQDGQSVGTVFIAVATSAEARVRALSLEGSRERIRRESTRLALEFALEVMDDAP